MGENGDAEAVTRQDLNQFCDFLLDQLKSHTSELSSKFNKAAFDAESALSVSKQVKAENDLKFNHPGNERNYKFNLEILELLEKLSKAIDAQETVKATQLLDSSVLLLKERNRKIRIADSSDGSWLTVKHYESHAVALDFEDDRGIRAAEREAIRDRNRTRLKRIQNAERLQNRNSAYSQPFGGRGQFQRGAFTTSTFIRPQQHHPDTFNRGRGACRFCGSFGHWWRECPVRLARTAASPRCLEQAPARPLPINSSASNFLGSLSSDASEMLRTCDKSQATSKEFEVPENVLSQEFCTLLAMEDKSFDISFYRQNLFEYEQGLAVPVVKGRLKAHFQFWVDIGAPPWVLETISSGYFIPFDSTPPSVCLPNNRSALDHHDFVSSAVSDLLKLGLVSEVSALPTVINPLSVSVNSEGKPRLILDLRHVNKHIPKAKFKMEDWRVFLQYVAQGGFMYKFDLKSGYHHIDICQSHQQFLGFKWHLDGCVDRYFCFTVLPFGLSSAPYLFTKFFRPLVRHWRSLGIHLVLYLMM